MKATDLMIGDWVQNQDGSIKGRIVNIDSYKNRVEFDVHTIDADFVYPIPLTEEILDKNSYLEVNVIDYNEPRIGISILYKQRSNEESGFRFLIGKNIPKEETKTIIMDLQYIHELQHALKLCKIDKEIVL